MKNHASFLVLVIVFLAGPLWAKTVTLQECLEAAQKNNPALRTAAWDTRLAEQNIRQTSSALYPRIDAQAGYTMQQAPQAVRINGFTAETQEPDYASAGLAANYTIYDFGRRNARITQASLQAESTAGFFDARKADLSMQVIEAFFRILETSKLITAAEEEVAQVMEHRRVAQTLYEEGVVTRNDVLQADVRLAAARQNLLAIKNRRENYWLQLNFLTGVDQTFRGELDEQSGLASIAKINAAGDSAITNRAELKALRAGVKASEASVKENRSSFYPELFTRLGLDYVQNDKVKEQTIMSAMVGIKVNLFDGFASTAALKRAVDIRSRNQDALRQNEEQVRLEVATAQNDIQVAKERIATTQAAILQSEENLRINRERYQERVGTATEMLDAQTLLTQTKTSYFQAIFDHQVSTARLKRALGEL
ncbi:MAG TPA: TolC family protein [Desulfuromonadaceae bacterium]|jgi:outer membrane protein TolC